MSSDSDFSTDQVFSTREDLLDWVQNVARSLGYVIIIKRSKTKSSGYVCRIILMCDRNGIPNDKETPYRSSSSKKCNCPFKLSENYSKTNDCWSLKVILDEHNHEPALYLEGHPYARRFSDNEARLVTDLSRKKVVPSDILTTLKEQNKNNVSTIKTVYNEIHKIKMVGQAGRTPMQVLFSTLHDKGYTFEFRSNDVSNELEELFFIHPISLDIWRSFPHVLLIDATYKTNIYNLHFLQIIGVTSTQISFCITYVFMYEEKISNYKWALNCLKLNMDESVYPRVIVTDRELTLMNVCSSIFLEAKQLLCIWHISESIFRNCRRSVHSCEDWGYLRAQWKKLCESPTIDAYLTNYANIESLLIGHQVILNYLNKIWLDKYKEMFVFVWTDQFLNFENHTTNRVESLHAKLKRTLGSTNSTLDRFVTCINDIVNSQYTAIKSSLEVSRIYIKKEHKIQNFQHLWGFVSKQGIDLIFDELECSNGLELTFENCGCLLRTSCGLPCACFLAMYLNSGQYIPLDSIDVFWRKLDLLSSTSMQDDDIGCENELEMLKKSFHKQSKFGKAGFLRKIKEIYDASKTLIGEPDVQKNTCGRPSLKSKQQKTVRLDPSVLISPSQDPHRHSYSNASGVFGSNLNQEPARHSFYVNPMRYSHPLLNYIPAIYRPYITHIQDVDGDGNCGFRSVAVNRGLHQNDYPIIRRDLINELYAHMTEYAEIFGPDFTRVYNSLHLPYNGDAPFDQWMIMPDTGFLIASRYNVIVHFLSNVNNFRLLPLWTGPSESQPNVKWVIAHILGNHFITVQLEGQYPIPIIHPQWFRSRYECASRWENLFNV